MCARENGGGGHGEKNQIRSLELLTGIGVRGIPRQRAVALADYGPIKGHKVTKGSGLDSLCIACLDAGIGSPAHGGIDLCGFPVACLNWMGGLKTGESAGFGDFDRAWGLSRRRGGRRWAPGGGGGCLKTLGPLRQPESPENRIVEERTAFGGFLV